MSFVRDFSIKCLQNALFFKNEHFAYHLPTKLFFDKKTCEIPIHFLQKCRMKNIFEILTLSNFREIILHKMMDIERGATPFSKGIEPMF